jgi:cell division topological specificity factor
MEQMKEELIDVISRYVEIDRDALDLCLEAETNTIALVANIPVLRTRSEQEKLQNQIDAAMTESQPQEACNNNAEPQTEECEYVCEVVDETIQCGCECENEQADEGCGCDSSCDCGCQKTE